MTLTTVLIVDDDAADLQILRTAFTSVDANLSVTTTESVDRALAWIAELPPASLSSLLVVTDLNMPVADGADMLNGIRRLTDPSPITIVLSTSSRSADVDRAYASGASAYHTKPMGYFETAALCRQLLVYWNEFAQTPHASLRVEGDIDVIDTPRAQVSGGSMIRRDG